VLVEPSATRQLFNDTATDQLWLVVGAPPEPANTLEMSAAELDWIYPDGPKALPAELQTTGTRGCPDHPSPHETARPGFILNAEVSAGAELAPAQDDEQTS
jgi:hypothetical protein